MYPTSILSIVFAASAIAAPAPHEATSAILSEQYHVRCPTGAELNDFLNCYDDMGSHCAQESDTTDCYLNAQRVCSIGQDRMLLFMNGGTRGTCECLIKLYRKHRPSHKISAKWR
ncbi:hypothetical protein F5Y15DRAFT_87915 [Xylariaceae sp. FL0016]|nr:hypothetical protein F5Y15DRAFT_87915 [Xylariaceae sp. FL0016]